MSIHILLPIYNSNFDPYNFFGKQYRRAEHTLKKSHSNFCRKLLFGDKSCTFEDTDFKSSVQRLLTIKSRCVKEWLEGAALTRRAAQKREVSHTKWPKWFSVPQDRNDFILIQVESTQLV
jgi:hypothetical protein